MYIFVKWDSLVANESIINHFLFANYSISCYSGQDVSLHLEAMTNHPVHMYVRKGLIRVLSVWGAWQNVKLC